MTRREDLWNELKAFCLYIEEWYPDVSSVYLFGSCLWKDAPNDLDVYIEYDGYSPKEAYKKIFPNIHLFCYRKDALTTYQLVWKRVGGFIVGKLPFIEREVMIEELMKLRKQVDSLKEKLESHSHASCSEEWGYFGPY